MNNFLNIHCDESCHLEHDGQPVMLFSAVWCPHEEIDRMVYELYGLTDEEIAIVEGASSAR